MILFSMALCNQVDIATPLYSMFANKKELVKGDGYFEAFDGVNH
jgi:hypothetical protein